MYVTRTGGTLALATLLVMLCVTSVAASTRIVIPGGTAVTVVVVDPISSATANAGDTFGIRSTEEVVVNGWVVIAKGAPGQGEVLTVERAGKHGHAGTMGIQMDWIYAADGEKIRLTSQRKTQAGEGKEGQSSTVTIISAVFLGLPGLFAHNFVKGRDITLDSTHPLQAYVSDSVYVAAKAHPTNPDAGFAKAAGNTNAAKVPATQPSPRPRG